MLIESEAIDNVAHVGRELIDVTVQVRPKLVRIVEQLFEVEL